MLTEFALFRKKDNKKVKTTGKLQLIKGFWSKLLFFINNIAKVDTSSTLI